MTAMTPWPHQQRTHAQVGEAYRQGKRSILIVAPTGSGKTFMGSRFASGGTSKGSRVLWLAHREELIDQAAGALRDAGCTPGIIAPWAPRSDSTLQVASIQTLLSRGQFPEADILVLDEAHHHVSPEWTQIPKHYQERKTLIIGLTATPQRGDGVGLGNVFDSMVVACQPRELISSGHLVRAVVKRPPRQSKALADHPVQAYREYASGRRAIVFCQSVQHASKLAHEFTAFGFPAASVDGKMDRDERRRAIARFRVGELRVLTNMHVLTEGFDARETDCVILARGFTTEGAYIQAVGRGMRKADGKSDCLVLDLRGSSHEHGLPDDDRLFSLDGRAIQTAEGLPPVRTCPQCGHVYRASEYEDSRCPGCGFFRKGRMLPSVRKQLLSDASASDTVEDRTTYLSRLVNTCLIDGKKVGQAKILFKFKYSRGRDCWPHAGQLADSGYNDAASVLREVSMYNTVRRTGLRPVIEGIPGCDVKTRPHVDTKALVALIRQALIDGRASADITGRRITVTMADAAEQRRTGT